MNIGGLDIGTTGCKLTVYNEDGRLLATAYRDYPVSRSTSAHEINPDDIWNSVKTVTEELTKSLKIDAMGVTSFGESFAAVDENGAVLFPAMLYTDPRGSEQASRFPKRKTEEICGVTPDKMFSLPKLMWLKENRADIFKKIRRVLLMQDFIVYRLCGTAQIDCSLASRTMAFDIHKREWSNSILDAAGIDKNLFSTPVPSGTPAGKSDICGLSGCTIVSGCHDQIASAIGAGAKEIGDAVDGMGTVECITPVFGEIPTDRAFISDGYSVLPFTNGLFACYALSFCCGALTDWFRKELAAGSAHTTLEAKVNPNEPGEIMVLPHFAGAATPYMDECSKGAIVNLTLSSTKEDIYRAILESTSYEMLINIKRMERSGIHISSLAATGGGAKSDAWLQLKANITGLEITTTEANEVGALGTAMLAAAACGVFKDISSAQAAMIKPSRVFVPNKEAHEKFMKVFSRYEKLYNAVRPLTEE